MMLFLQMPKRSLNYALASYMTSRLDRICDSSRFLWEQKVVFDTRRHPYNGSSLYLRAHRQAPP